MHDVWSPRAVPIILLDPHFTTMCNRVTRDCYPGYEIDTFYCLTCKYDRYIYIYTRLSGAKHNLLFDFVTAYRFVCPSHSTTVCFHGIWKFDGEHGFLSVSFQRLSSSPLFSQTDCLLSRYQLDPVQMVKMVTFIRKIISFNFGSNLKSWRPRLFFFRSKFSIEKYSIKFYYD